jgi:hypothetical protein
MAAGRDDIDDGQRPAWTERLVQAAEQAAVGGLAEQVAEVARDRQVVAAASHVDP